jgi:hypothetical protein
MEQEAGIFDLDKSNSKTSGAGSSNSGGTSEVKKNVTAKNFFDLMSTYLNQVDSFLYQSIHTFHHIVKNAAMK